MNGFNCKYFQSEFKAKLMVLCIHLFILNLCVNFFTFLSYRGLSLYFIILMVCFFFGIGLIETLENSFHLFVLAMKMQLLPVNIENCESVLKMFIFL